MRIAQAALAVMLAAPALADVGDQLARIIASDADIDDQFGKSVAVDGQIAVVGAIRADEGAPSSGAAYLFDISDPTKPRELSKLIADDVPESRRFGNAVAIDGNIVVVGASLANDNGGNSGAAYIFDVTDPVNPFQIAKLLPDDTRQNAQFGNAVAVDGDIVLVAARLDDLEGELAFAGSAYLYRASTGQFLSKFIPDVHFVSSHFGDSVALSDGIAAIGAPEQNGGRGFAYIFDVSDPLLPFQLARIFPIDHGHVHFGAAVALADGILVVGEPLDDDTGDHAGSATIYDISDPSSPQRLADLLASDARPDDGFGDNLAVSGSIVIVGVRNLSAPRNRAYLFDISDPATPIELSILTPQNEFVPGENADYDRFGFGVATDAGNALVGASLDDAGGFDVGAVYIFRAALCPADIDGDGDADAEDFFAYLDLFANGDDRADIDGDGDIDAEDFFAYLDLFVQPCQ